VTSLVGFGAAVPERVVANAELAESLGVTEEWILQACGIRERRYVAPGETGVDLAERAANAALGDAGLTGADLRGIVVGSGTAPRAFPGISADLQKRLGAAGGPAFDVPLASVGGLFALALAQDLAPRYGPILVVGADVMSAVVERPPRGKETAILFGDGAGACIVAPGDGGPHRLVDVRIASDGTFTDDLALLPGAALTMNGRQVILQANRKLQAAVNDVVTRNGLTLADIDLFVFHQANRNLLAQVGKSLKLDESKVFLNIERLGNTSAASLLIARTEAHSTEALRPGGRAVVAAFGAGFSWGAGLIA